MIFEPGKNKLREIHEFMTQIDIMRLERENSRMEHNADIVKQLFQIGHDQKSNKTYSEKATYSLFIIESDINQLKFEIDTYKHNLLISKIFFLEFKRLKASYLK